MTCSAVYREPLGDPDEAQKLDAIFGKHEQLVVQCERHDGHQGSHVAQYGDLSLAVWDDELAITAWRAEGMFLQPVKPEYALP